MVQLKLRRHDAPSYKVAFIEFPAIESKLDEAMRGIDVGISTEKNCIVEEISGDNGGLQSLVGKRINADEVQYLARHTVSHAWTAFAEPRREYSLIFCKPFMPLSMRKSPKLWLR